MPGSVRGKGGTGIWSEAVFGEDGRQNGDENGAKLCSGAEGRTVTPPLPRRGHGRGPGQGSGHTSRQEEAAKISRGVEKGGESVKEITERLARKGRGSELKTARMSWKGEAAPPAQRRDRPSPVVMLGAASDTPKSALCPLPPPAATRGHLEIIRAVPWAAGGGRRAGAPPVPGRLLLSRGNACLLPPKDTQCATGTRERIPN